MALQELDRVNVFYGPNGAGKTSILESIHVLGMARSFRGNSIKSLISHGAQTTTVFGEIATGGSEIPLGVQRSRDGEVRIKVGGSPVRTITELVVNLPLQVINAESFDLLTGSPQSRRQYLDWGVFHVEHRFFVAWQRFQRCIKQRNKLLRRDKIPADELTAWTRDLVSAGTAINEYRQAYFQQLVPRFNAIVEELVPSLEQVELRFRKGWDRDLDLASALDKSLESDREQGYTHVGPQRADIRTLVAGHLAAETLSRGQQKLVVCALKLAQGQLMSEAGGKQCTYLVDDLPSELDEHHNRQVCGMLARMDSQVFITCVERDDIQNVWPGDLKPAMFHVEHGVVNPVTVPSVTG